MSRKSVFVSSRPKSHKTTCTSPRLVHKTTRAEAKVGLANNDRVDELIQIIGTNFSSRKIGPIELKIGNILRTAIYVAPINDMLLGMDVLKWLQAKVDVGKGQLYSGSEIINLKISQIKPTKRPKKGQVVKIDSEGAVLLIRKVKVPPKSEIILPMRTHTQKDGEISIFEASRNVPLMIAN